MNKDFESRTIDYINGFGLIVASDCLVTSITQSGGTSEAINLGQTIKEALEDGKVMMLKSTEQ